MTPVGSSISIAIKKVTILIIALSQKTSVSLDNFRTGD